MMDFGGEIQFTGDGRGMSVVELPRVTVGDAVEGVEGDGGWNG